MTEYTSDRINKMTEHEMIYSLCTQRITVDELYASWGYYPRTDSVVEEYEKYKRYCENTDLYWDERIDRVRGELETLESNKGAGILPPIPYSY